VGIFIYLADMRKRLPIALFTVVCIAVILVFSVARSRQKLLSFFSGNTKAWEQKTSEETENSSYYKKSYKVEFLTPVLHIDTIYHSMAGPTAAHPCKIESNGSRLLWIKDYSIEVTDKSGKELLSKDFMCHNILNINISQYLQHFGISDRKGTTGDRFLTLTEGQDAIKFPEGFGIPIFSDNNIGIYTRALNHNIFPVSLDVRHRIRFGYVRDEELTKPLKPLYKHALYIAVPVKRGSSLDADACIQECAPPGVKDIWTMPDGTQYANHWIIKQGRDTIKYNVTHLMQLKENMTMHFASVHLHSYAESLTLRDITADSIVYTSHVKNYSDRTGMDNIEYYSSEVGRVINKDHQYELICITNNTSGKVQDMMAVMIIFTEDTEMENNIAKLKARTKN
jgi:hypothetical protein